MVNLNFIFLLLLLVICSTGVETSSRWTSVMPLSVKKHGNVSILGRDFRFDVNSSAYEVASAYDMDSTEEHSGTGSDEFFTENETLDSTSLIKLRRFRRSKRKWIELYSTIPADIMKMHAFVVKDEDIPDCGVAADIFSKTRYYICSGTVLSDRHILTSATCMNKAVFYDYEVHADIAVVVGDFDEYIYVMKVADYAMHPKYDPNPASSVHELNNLAVMSLSCPIPDGKIVLPKLATQKYDDLAHKCCADKCSINSVFRLAHNRYILQSKVAKYIPTFDKVHGKDFSVRSIRDNQNSFISSFYSKKTMDQINKNKFPEVKNSTLTIDDGNFSDKLLLRLERDTSKDNTDLPSHWAQVIQEINAGNVSKKSKDYMNNFLKIAMTDVLETIIKVLSTHVGDVANVYPYFLEAVNSENVTMKVEQSLMNYLVKTMEKSDLYKNESINNRTLPTEFDKSDIRKVSPKGSRLKDDIALREFDASDKSKEKFEFFCPAIGTPVIQNRTVIGLIVYTCDEVQNWVAWKYVEIMHNTEWIRKQTKMVSYEKIDE